MISRLRIVAALFQLPIWLTLSLSSVAQCDFTEVDSGNYLGSLQAKISTQACFGGSADTSPITVAVTKALGDIKTDYTSESELLLRRDRLAALLTQIEGSLTGAMPSMNASWRGYAAITLNELATAKNELRNMQSIVPATYWQWHSANAFFESPTTGQFLISYEVDVVEACAAGFTDDCRINLESAGTLVRHVQLVQNVLMNPVRTDLQRLHEQISALDSEWKYYFEEARSQYWWEFVANNALYDPKGNVLAPPPGAQLILLHPSAAMEYVESNATVDESYNFVGLIEVIGYNRLRWKENGPYSRWPLGVSAVATYVPGTNGDDFGYGLMLHIKNDYSLGVTRRDTGAGEETTWMLSVDLTKLFLTKSAEARAWFRSLD